MKLDEKKTKSGHTKIPFIDIEGIYITGCNKGEINEAIEKRRAL